MRYLLVLSLCAFSAQATTNYQAECITKARSFIGKIVTKNQLNLVGFFEGFVWCDIGVVNMLFTVTHLTAKNLLFKESL